MKFPTVQPIPDLLRPYFPFHLVQVDGAQLIFEKATSPFLFLYFISTILFFIGSIYLARLSIFAMFIVSAYLLIFHLFYMERYSEIMATRLGITLIRKLLFVKRKSFIPKDEIRCLKSLVVTRNEVASYGNISIVQLNGRMRIILYLQRTRRNQVEEDIGLISAKIAKILSISVEQENPH